MCMLLFSFCTNNNSNLRKNNHDTEFISYRATSDSLFVQLDVIMLNERLCDISGCILAMVAIELSLHLVYLCDVNMDQAWYRSWENKIPFTE